VSSFSWTKEQLEYVACDYCGGEDFREVTVRPDGLRVVECWGCGLSLVIPRLALARGVPCSGNPSNARS